MPTASRNERKKRRTRRNLTLAKRMLQQQAIGRFQALTALFAILTTHGTEATLEVPESALAGAGNLLQNGRLIIEKNAAGNYDIRIGTADEVEVQSTSIQSQTEEDPGGGEDQEQGAPIHEQLAVE